MTWPILSVVTFLPLVGALFIALVRGNEPFAKGTARWVALWTTLVTFAISLVMVGRFDPASAEFQFVEKHAWLGVAGRVLWTTGRIVKLQTGYVYHYAFAMLIGVALILTWFMFYGGVAR